MASGVQPGQAVRVVSTRSTSTRLCRSADVLIECGAVPVDLGPRCSTRRTLRSSPCRSRRSAGRGPEGGWAATDLTVGRGERPAGAHRRRRPAAGADQRAPGLFHHAAADAAVAALVGAVGAGALGPRASTSTCRPSSAFMRRHPGHDARRRRSARREAQRLAGGLERRAVSAAPRLPGRDGHVSITFLFGDTIGPFTQRLMSWVHEEGCCDEAPRDIDYVARSSSCCTPGSSSCAC